MVHFRPKIGLHFALSWKIGSPYLRLPPGDQSPGYGCNARWRAMALTFRVRCLVGGFSTGAKRMWDSLSRLSAGWKACPTRCPNGWRAVYRPLFF